MFVIPAVVEVTLQGERVGACRRVVRAKPATLSLPAIVSCAACGVLRRSPVEILSVNAVGHIVANFVAIATSHGAAFCVAATCGHNSTLRNFGFLGDDVNYAVDSVRSPQSCTGSPNDFDAVDILEHDVLNVPVNSGEERRVYAPAVDEDQQFVVKASIEAARTDGPFVFVNARHFQTRD